MLPRGIWHRSDMPNPPRCPQAFSVSTLHLEKLNTCHRPLASQGFSCPSHERLTYTVASELILFVKTNVNHHWPPCKKKGAGPMAIMLWHNGYVTN